MEKGQRRRKAKTEKLEQPKKEADFKLPVYNKEGKITGQQPILKSVFGKKPNDQIISQAVRVYQNRLNKLLATSKSRSEVSGGGRKPWRQKGTGRARSGTIRAPQWRGGGIVFGPRSPRRILELPQKIRKAALATALSNKYRKGDIVLLDQILFREPKTKKALEIISKLPITNRRNVLLILEEGNLNTVKSFRNIENVSIAKALDLNVIDVLKSSSLIFTVSSLKKFEERFLNGKAVGN